MKTFWKIFFGSLLAFLVASILSMIIFFGIVGAMIGGSSKGAEPITGESILKFSFSASVSEQSQESFSWSPAAGPDFSSAVSLYDYVRAIDRAAEDPSIKFIYMTPDDPMLSQAQAEEIRAALLRFRASGKAIVSYTNRMTDRGYYLASVADKVLMNSYGDAMMLGMSSSMAFFKDALDRLGINVQLIRHGKYKSAGETFVKSDISPENREQNEVMLRSLWNAMVTDICASRDLNPDQYNRWIDNLELSDAPSLLARGLVDELLYETEAEDYLCSLVGVKEPDDLRFVDIARYAAAPARDPVRGARNRIAVVYCNGEIVVEGPDGALAGEQMARTLAKIRRDSTVKAVVLRVNSPGGDAQGAEIINHELGLLKEVKPVIASYGDYAASGGYWISARSDKIFTNRSTLTGSIGVFSLIPSFGNALRKKVGVNIVNINTHRHSSALSLMNPLDASEQAYLARMTERVYSDFTEIVAEGRRMPVGKVDELGQGRVWTGSDAVERGLADEIGGLVDAIDYAAAAAGLSEGAYRVETYPAVKSVMERLMESFSKTRSSLEAAADPMAAIESAYAKLRKENKARIYARLPWIYQFD